MSEHDEFSAREKKVRERAKMIFESSYNQDRVDADSHELLATGATFVEIAASLSGVFLQAILATKDIDRCRVLLACCVADVHRRILDQKEEEIATLKRTINMLVDEQS